MGIKVNPEYFQSLQNEIREMQRTGAIAEMSPQERAEFSQSLKLHFREAQIAGGEPIFMRDPGLVRGEDVYPDMLANEEYAYQSFNHILETGQIVSPTRATEHGQGNFSLDLEKGDALTQSIDQMIQNVEQRLIADPQTYEIINRLQAGQGTRDDRLTWEDRLAHEVSTEMDNIAGLDTYRQPKPNNDFVRSPDLNEGLSADISSGAPTHEFECEVQSIIEGTTIQRIENELLGPAAGTYLYTAGKTSFMSDAGPTGGSGHAFIVTPAGSIVESNVDPDNPQQAGRFNYIETNRLSSADFMEEGYGVVLNKSGHAGADVYGVSAFNPDIEQEVTKEFRDIADDQRVGRFESQTLTNPSL